MDHLEAAALIAGVSRAENRKVSQPTNVHLVTMEAVEASADGTVLVDPGGDVFTPDESQYVEIETVGSIAAGDDVTVLLTGEPGGAMDVLSLGPIGEGDRQDAAIDDAARAAETAWNWADEAHTAATEAQERADEAAQSAENAAQSASTAATAATNAQQSASTAATAATSAQGDASTAAQAATAAQGSASTAASAAQNAEASASAAASDASAARQSASSAQTSATRANTAANDALAQLDTVQDVLGVVQWVAEHGTFAKTTDTTLDPSKVYYVRTGSGTSADPYLYTAVGEPKQADIGSYYELTMDQALSQYVASHLALTDAGLYVLKDASGYRVLLSNTGMSVIDPQGHTVATYGESVTFDSSRPQYIGGENAYIVYYDSDDDGSPDTIRIGGHVLMGGSKTLSEVLEELDEATGVDAVGRNLLRKTATVTAADLARTLASVPEAGIIRLTPTSSASYAKFVVDYLDFADYGEGDFTVSFDAREVDDGSGLEANQNLRVYLGFSIASRINSTFSSSSDRYTYKYDALTDQWVRYSFTFKVPDDLKSGQETALVAGSQLSVEFFRYRGYLPVEVRNVKLERGTKATAWAMAPEDLVGITSTAVSYGTSASATAEPSAWQATLPAVGAGQWLWTRTVTAYTDGSTTTAYSKSYAGTNGSSVTVSAVEYGTSADGTTQPTSWQATVPTVQLGHWLWTRTTYTDGTEAVTKSYAGTNGSDGTSVTILGSYNTLAELQAAHSTGSLGDGYIVAGDLYIWDGSAWADVGQIQGPQGPSGTSVTVSRIEYGVSDDVTTQPTYSTTPPASVAQGKWLWVRTTYSDATTATTKSYVGTDGQDGTSVNVTSATKAGGVTTVTLSDGTTLTIEDGTDGTNGTDGLSGYVHTAWANSADGSDGFSTTVSAGKLYLGVYTDHTAADSADYRDYSWSLIKGADGADGPDGRNLLLGTSEAKTATIAGATSNAYTGYYAESDYGKTVTAGNATDLFAVGFDWAVDVPEGGTAGGEAWIQIEGTIISGVVDAGGFGGSQGKRGIDLSAGSGHYWALFRLTAAQAALAQQRMRIRARGTTDYPACPGEALTVSHVKFERTDTAPTGWSLAPEDLVGISSTAIAYGTSDGAATEPTTWAATPPISIGAGAWVWVRTTTAYTDGTETVAYSKAYVGTNGTNGQDGTGIESITEQWYLSTSSSAQAGGSWGTAQPAWEAGKYIWYRHLIAWTDGSTSTTEPQLANALNGTGEMIYDAQQDIDAAAGSIVSLARGDGTFVAPDGTTVESGIGTTLTQHADAIALRATKTEVQQVRPAYASSTTAAGTKAKVATIDPAVTGYALYKGASVSVTFSTANTAAAPTLNVNSTGAKQIRSYAGAALSEAEYKWAAGATLDLVYDGTYWRMTDGGATKRVTAAEAQLTVQADQISSKVSSTDYNGATIASLINQSADTVKIEAQHVEVTGAAVFKAVNGRDGTTKIDGGKVDVSSITVGDLSDGGDYATTTQAQGYATTAQSNAINAAASDATTKANAAAQTATNYIHADSTGIRIASANPSTATTYQHQTATETEFVVGGTSMAEFGGSGARVGAEDGTHVVMDASGVVLNRYNTSTEVIDELAQFGMGERGPSLALGDFTVGYFEPSTSAGSTVSWTDLTHIDGPSIRLGQRATSLTAYDYITMLADRLGLNDYSFEMSQVISAIPVTLFTGSYSTTRASVVTLSESAENFSMLRVICEDSDGQQVSTDIYDPDGKKFSVTTSTSTQTTLYVKSKSYQISGTAISCVQVGSGSGSYYRHGEASISASGVTYDQSKELIGIIRVIGFR